MNTPIPRITLQPGYSISRIIKGNWQLAGGHGAVDERQAIRDMRAFVEAGITTFDCADIYTGVEALIGQFIREHRDAMASGTLPALQIHTKYVPDENALATLTLQDTQGVIDRSLKRLGVERLDLVQFAWWNTAIPGYVEAALHLSKIKQAGKIRYLGVTNFSAAHVRELLDAGVPILTNQVQYSVLDHRPEQKLQPLAEAMKGSLLCYGALAGGFLSNRYLGLTEDQIALENRSLVKYRLIIDEFGGYGLFQELLQVLHGIASQYGVGIAEVAARYVLQKPNVAAVIIGARNTHHLERLKQLGRFHLDQADLDRIQAVVSRSTGPTGAVYDLERDRTGKHGRIMKYNLNEQRP